MDAVASDKLISLLICSKDRGHQLRQLVSDLKGMHTKYPFQIIVVEETDKDVPIDGVEYVSHPVANRGIPFARNLAFERSKGEIIVYLDDDCRIGEGWLDRLLEPFGDDSVIGVQGGVTVAESTNAVGWVETILGFPGGGIGRILRAQGKVQETREISTLNCAYRRWAIEKVGGFNERLKAGGEDYLLAKMISEHGRCLFVPNATVVHEARGSLAKIWRWFTRRGQAEIDVLRTGEQKDINFFTIFRGSLIMKLILLSVIALFSPGLSIFLILLFLLVNGVFQSARHYKVWKESGAPKRALILLPVVKLTMDIATDWGRLRGIAVG
jgi:cellulose synthase/poly-beta-1,6-N-acetylglucosamine synthase-like glycosyltransferase